jgi:hypothetical protein
MLLSWIFAAALAEPSAPYQDLDCDGIPNPIDWRTTPPTPLPPSYDGQVEEDNAESACVKWPDTRRLRPDGTSTCSSDEVVQVSCGPFFDTGGIVDTDLFPGSGRKWFVLDPAVVDPDSDGLGTFTLPPDCRPIPGQGGFGSCDVCPYDATIPFPNQAEVREDRDFDGTPDVCDACPATPGPFVPSDGDGDGLDDLCDRCPTVADAAQVDGDGDGTPDSCDDCPDVAGTQGDADLDGLGDACDACDRTLAGQLPGTDSDADGFEDGCDVCPDLPNPDQADAEFDGVGDACDACPLAPDPFQPDRDLDGVGDACDVCPEVADPGQADRDADLIGDACAPTLACGCASGPWDGGWWAAWTLAAAALRRRKWTIPEAAAR